MTTSELITTAMKYYDNVDPTDSDYTERRERNLFYAQAAVDEIIHAEDWTFTLTSGSVSITAGASSGSLPEDFGAFHRDHVLYRADGLEIKEIPIQELLRIRKESLDGNAPSVFAIYGDTIQTAVVSTAQTLSIFYKKAPETLEDTSNEADSNLDQIPIRYHHSVVLPLLVAKLQEGKGDAREWLSHYRRGFEQMRRSELPGQSQPKQLPLHYGGRMC